MTVLSSISPQTLDDVLFAVTSRLRRLEQRPSFALHVRGLLTDLPRQSTEPIAAWAAGGDPAACERPHDHLRHFLHHSPWNERERRLAVTDLPLESWLASEPLDAHLVVDTRDRRPLERPDRDFPQSC